MHLIIGFFFTLLGNAAGYAWASTSGLSSLYNGAAACAILGSIFGCLALFMVGFEFKTNMVTVIFVGMAAFWNMVYLSIWTNTGNGTNAWNFGVGWAGWVNLLVALAYKVLDLMGKLN